MKLIEALLALCLLNAKSDHRFSIGIVNGIGPSWVARGQQMSALPGYTFGTSFYFSKQVDWAFGGDVCYSIEGAQVTDQLEHQSYYRLQYIRAPFKVYYFLSPYGKKVRPKVAFGTSYGYLINTQNVSSKPEMPLVHSSPIESPIKSFDVGALGSLGLSISLADRISFDTEITYYHGFIDLNETGIQNRNISLNFGLTFEVGRVPCY